MPRSSGFDCASEKMRAFARESESRNAVAMSVVSLSRNCIFTVSPARRDAVAPPRCPPMPSATISNRPPGWLPLSSSDVVYVPKS
jgi:hypothetical protein